MLLAINANNTNTSFAVWDGAALKGSWRTATEGKRTADEYVVWLDHLLALDGLSRAQIEGAAIASVVPETNFNLVTFCRKYCRAEPLVVGDPGVALNTRALVDRPEEVGADRLVNTVAAHDRYQGPLIVVDLGTATTLDVIDGDGNYRGGVIAPGINLSLTALHMAAAKLPSVRIARTERVIGTDTVSCMQSGIYWGYIGLIEGLVGRIKGEFGAAPGSGSGSRMPVIATGGLAPLFAGATPAIDRVDSDLTLWGLRLIYGYNSKR
jgi:type III pantothenate kinase